MKKFYFILTILGALVPWYYFLCFWVENGFDIILFVNQLNSNDITRFFVADVIISALVLIPFVVHESKRLKIPNGIFTLLGLCIGVSFALPLFLYMRERHIDNNTNSANFNTK
ncbi:hypothetical protein Xmau_04102 [Xenorhabdus mauleonii]|uniref:DUF2834 domain-containing protein n=1 Tax=Xenorhabdus mauleonii TaxID=351675 RepID=A0A1I3W8M2_9GAMM|nr:DUF2834 domain-containing protein [Xenorhabdus mauleonii]PHM36739.1 hypothetical protein Xmau_04102 [Xenorhabdus mauleonii]SFK03938.1 Protein of unknown function [Xenorhabdus mauleonii]